MLGIPRLELQEAGPVPHGGPPSELLANLELPSNRLLPKLSMPLPTWRPSPVLQPALRRDCCESCCAAICAALEKTLPLAADRSSNPPTDAGGEATVRLADEDRG